ncbi:MAG: O-succinylbenzoate synthase [Candidatus Eisenbacteria bacterium]|nr:O-succinylbenzoate synthase [Candidatus Eisenbacteria bacterium]
MGSRRTAIVRIERFSGAIGAASNARRSWGRREGFLVTIEDDGGMVGTGEASPLPGYSPDDIARSARALRGACASPPSPLRPDRPVEPQLVTALRDIDPGAPAARFAIESALLDLAARRAGVSVSRLLAGDRAERTIPLSALLRERDPDRVATEARGAAARGVAALKMKVGVPGRFDEEAEAFRRAREAAGGAILLRADANGAWSPAEARRKMAVLAETAPEYVEQPVGAEELLRFAGAPVPVAADETLLLPGAAGRLLRGSARERVRVLVLKPTLLGGFTAALRIARSAERAGTRVTVGHALEGPVALAAAAELALALPGEPLPCGLDPHPGLEAWPAGPPPQIGPAVIRPSGRTGLGVDPRRDRR